MTIPADNDTRAQARLSVVAQELEALERAISLAVAGAQLPSPMAEIFIRLAAAAEVCEGLIADHASSAAPLSLKTLGEVAEALRLIREVTTSLVGLALARPRPRAI